ncbi:MAG: hypothetical protein H6867_10335 [Rhodospirillales bacterium]|nr:hypothetical protein [Rhodospirillales bacterium]MCB9995818.1 hypothetical protein [Rhodospirillales bacterium]
MLNFLIVTTGLICCCASCGALSFAAIAGMSGMLGFNARLAYGTAIGISLILSGYLYGVYRLYTKDDDKVALFLIYAGLIIGPAALLSMLTEFVS